MPRQRHSPTSAQALCLMGMLRGRAVLWPAALAWQGGICLLCALNIAWGSRARRARRARRTAAAEDPHPDAYVRWREVPVGMLRLLSLGLGIGGEFMVRLLEQATAAAGDDGVEPWAAAHAARLLFASGAVHLLLFSIAWRLRPG